MKEKKLIAMFITSVVAFVASLTISLGVTLALADPVAAIGLAEISYSMSAPSASKQVVIDPSGAFNGDIEDYIIVNSYDDILYANETVCDSIKLLKVSVKNDTNLNRRFTFSVNVTGKTNAVKYANFAVVNASESGVIVNQPSKFISLNKDNISEQIEVKANSTAYFVVAGYVSDSDATEVVDLSAYMNMSVVVTRVDLA